LILLKGGELPRPVLQRFPAPSAEQLESGSHHSLLITLDHVTEEVKELGGDVGILESHPQ
jgi:hypothetical protein